MKFQHIVTLLSASTLMGCVTASSASSTIMSSSIMTQSSSLSSLSSSSSSSSVSTLPEFMLFDHGIMGDSQFYNYAPAAFEEEGTRYIYFCSNFIEGDVTDVIGYRKGTQNIEGDWEYTDFSYVLASTPDTWDSRHVCDPTVIKGSFEYDDVNYNYLMAYLGCVTSNNQLNDVGIAVAVTPDGPWVKVDELNPIADFTRLENDGFQWGYGQPSLISVDKESRALLFYTVGDGTATFTKLERWDFSDLNTPIMEEEKILTSKGIKSTTGIDMPISNADFAYDAVKNRIYMVSDSHPFESSEPSFISPANVLAYMNEIVLEGYVEPGDTFFNPQGRSWNIMTRVGPSMTGYPRNHNMGILKDPYGWIIDTSTIDVVYTVSIESSGAWWYWSTYRLFMRPIEVTE